MELETTKGKKFIDLSKVSKVGNVLETKTKDYDSYDITMSDGTIYEFFNSKVSRDFFCELLPRGNPFSTKKLLGLF